MYLNNLDEHNNIHLESNLFPCIHSVKYVHGLIQISSTLHKLQQLSQIIIQNNKNNIQQPHLGIQYIYLYNEGLLEPSLQTTLMLSYHSYYIHLLRTITLNGNYIQL